MALQHARAYLSRTVWLTLHLAIAVALVRFFFIGAGAVDGQSMEPTFHDQNLFLVNKIQYLLRPPRRFDVIQFYHPQRTDVLLVKRVIGLPDETVLFRRNGVYVRDALGQETRLKEPYLGSGTITRVQPGQAAEITVDAHTYLVLGDNRLLSRDSRDFGSVPRQLIKGKVVRIGVSPWGSARAARAPHEK